MPHDDLILLPFLGLATGSLGTLVGAARWRNMTQRMAFLQEQLSIEAKSKKA